MIFSFPCVYIGCQRYLSDFAKCVYIAGRLPKKSFYLLKSIQDLTDPAGLNFRLWSLSFKEGKMDLVCPVFDRVQQKNYHRHCSSSQLFPF